MNPQTDLLGLLDNHFNIAPDRRGERHVDCPFCGKSAKRGQTHFSFSSKGYKCHVCGEGGGLVKLASHLGLDGTIPTAPTPPRPRRESQKPKDDTPPVWRTDSPHADLLVKGYTSDPRRYELWQAYKPLSEQTIDRWGLGLGKLPGQTTPRLILPVRQNGQVVHLRGRLPKDDTSDLPKWLAAKGSTATLFNLDGLRPGHKLVILENPIDAALVMQEFPELDAVAPTNGAGSWQDEWTEVIASIAPSQIIVAYDNDLAGQANPVTAWRLKKDWQTKHPGRKPPRPNGPKLVKKLRKTGLKVSLWRWSDDTPAKGDMGWLLEQPGGIEKVGNRMLLLETETAETLPADLTVNLRYISNIERVQIPQTGGLLIKSPIGTGKTELIKRLKADFMARHGYSPKVSVITHLETLAKSSAARLGYESYKDHKPEYLRLAPTLSICLNSIPKLANTKDPLPQYDILVIDEVEQVLAALGSATFEPGEAVRTREILEYLVKNAGLVVCLDAYSSSVSQNWLKGLRPDVFTVVNTYTPDEKPPLTAYPTESQVIAAADDLIAENDGPVLVACSSRQKAKTLALRYEGMYPGGVQLVCQENSGEQTTQDFIASINERLAQIRVLVYTPSIGTGVDITAPVKAVVGVFNNQPLDAEACHQMLGRARYTPEVHIWVRQAEGKRPVDPDMLYEKQAAAALRTRHIATSILGKLDNEGRLTLDENHKGLLKLLCKVKARRNRSMNTLRENILRLAYQRYAVTIIEPVAPNEAVLQSVKESSAISKEHDKQAVLAATPVDHDEYEAIRESGRMTPEAQAGHIRWQIEDTYQQPLTPILYDEYDGGRGKKQLLSFIDLHKPIREIARLDLDQFDRGTEWHKLGHYTAKFVLTSKLLISLGLLDRQSKGFNPDRELTLEEIAATIEAMTDKLLPDLILYWNWRPDQSSDPLNVLRHVLKQLGLKLETIRSRQGNRYRLEKAALVKMLEYRTWRLAGLEQNRTPDESVQKSGANNFFSPDFYTSPQFSNPRGHR